MCILIYYNCNKDIYVDYISIFAIMNITWDYILTCTTYFKLILNHKVCPKMHIFLHFKCLVNDIITILMIIISHGLQWN